MKLSWMIAQILVMEKFSGEICSGNIAQLSKRKSKKAKFSWARQNIQAIHTVRTYILLQA